MLDEIIVPLEQKNDRDSTLQGIETFLFDQQISICFPGNFYELSEKKVKERYALEPRPNILYSDEQERLDFGFHLLQEKNVHVTVYLSKLKDTIKMVYPNTLVYEEETILPEQEGCEIRYFDFRTSSLEGAVYNMLYLASNKEKALMGSFNCPFETYKDWKPTAMCVIQTIKIKSKEKKE